MSRARTGAHRPNQHERRQRRGAVEHLLARALRGALTVPEAAVLADYWRQEQRAADATRKSLYDTNRALEKHREAADAAIRELEQRLAAHLANEEQRQGEAVDPVTLWPARAVEAVRTARRAAEEADQRATLQRDMHEARRRALADALDAPEGTQWQQLAALARRIRHDAWANGRDCREAHERARALEGELAAVRNQLADVKARHDDDRAGRQDAERALDRVRQADTLGTALAAVAQYDGVPPQAAALQAAITDRADTAAAQLAEQAREHAVELATERRTAERAVDAWKERAREAEEQAAQQRARANGWRAHAIETDDRADRHLAAWRNARARAAKRTAQRDRAEQQLATTREERDRALDLAAARGDALAAHLARTEAPR